MKTRKIIIAKYYFDYDFIQICPELLLLKDRTKFILSDCLDADDAIAAAFQ